MPDLSFPDAVAARSGHAVADVLEILTASRVPTTDLGGTPHRLRVTRLAFRGTKAGLLNDAIDFDQDFGNGLWAIASVRNDAGKTSILELIVWCLRGEPKRLQPDVRLWLDEVTLEGTVDDAAFVVAFDNTGGAPNGSLTCGADVRPFASEAAFADTMSQFMMERLGFDTFELWVKGQGLATHRWSSYSTVLYLPREAENAVIGDRSGDGVAQQLVQLYVGVPWARTHSACRAALNEAQEQAAKQAAAKQTVVSAAEGVINARETELASVRDQIEAMPNDLPSLSDITEARSTWMSLISRQAQATSELRRSEEATSAARAQARTARRRLQDITEAALARRLFQGLNPAKCPRCSVEIGQDRREAEKASHACAVCDRELDLDFEAEADELSVDDAAEADDQRSQEDLQDLVRDLDQQVSDQEAQTGEARRALRRLDQQVQDAERTVDLLDLVASQVEDRRGLEVRVASLEAVVAELQELSVAPEPSTSDPVDTNKTEILKAAVEEAYARRKAEFDRISAEINSTILKLARRFGFDSLEETTLDLAARLSLVKGGSKTSFSHQTPGEKLRLRIAVVVALLRIGNDHHVGRHPGLLLIDSIGAEETEAGNLAEFMRELQAVTQELEIETIVASARPEILEHVPAEHRLVAAANEYLW